MVQLASGSNHTLGPKSNTSKSQARKQAGNNFASSAPTFQCGFSSNAKTKKIYQDGFLSLVVLLPSKPLPPPPSPSPGKSPRRETPPFTTSTRLHDSQPQAHQIRPVTSKLATATPASGNGSRRETSGVLVQSQSLHRERGSRPLDDANHHATAR